MNKPSIDTPNSSDASPVAADASVVDAARSDQTNPDTFAGAEAQPAEPSAEAQPAEPSAEAQPAEPSAEAQPAEPSAEAQPAEPSPDTGGQEIDQKSQATRASSDPGEGPAQVSSETGEAPKKKKRKRRKKKKSGAANEAAAENKPGQTPFLHLFVGDHPSGRDHAFSAGEIVAGRVAEVRGASIFIDLFGKATAVMDLWEPREVPPLPIPEPATVPDAEQAQGTDSVPGPPSESASEPNAVVSEPSAAAEASAVASEASADSVVGAQPATPSASVVSTTEEVSQDEDDKSAVDISLEEIASASADVQDEADGEDNEDADESADAGVEVVDEPPPEPPTLGAIVRGRIGSVSESGTIAIVNRVIDRQAAKAKIEQARESRSRVQGLVFGFNRGGFDVLVEGIRVFCPANGMSLSAIADPSEYVGQRLAFSLPQRKGKSKGIVVSRRAILERDARKLRRERLKEIESDMELDAVVTQVKDFGLFADVGHGLEGLVHQSELAWAHGTRPGDVAKPGDTIKVKVLGIKKEGKRLRDVRISLSRKALLPDPWDKAADKVKPGAVIEGRVTNTTDFGAFVHLADGIEGLLHINELGKNLKHASHALSIGDPVTVVVDRMDKAQRRISLSKLTEEEQKAVQEGTFDPAQRPKSLKPGSHIKVVVDRVEHTGVQVRVQGVLGRKARGFIHSRDLGTWGSGEKRRRLDAGTEMDVKVVGTDRSGALKLSVKGFENDAERQAVREYRKEASKQGFGTFGDLLRAKLETGSDS